MIFLLESGNAISFVVLVKMCNNNRDLMTTNAIQQNKCIILSITRSTKCLTTHIMCL